MSETLLNTAAVDIDLLRAYVRESNAIEGIGAVGYFLKDRWRDPYVSLKYYEGHMQAAQFVVEFPDQAIEDPRRVHTVLFRELGEFAGVYRTTALMQVGDRTMPHPRHVAKLMQEWVGFARAWVKESSDWSDEWRFERALMLHNLFLCIHPFEDGNGRTARLLYNALRLEMGLPWSTIYAGNYDFYRDQLVRFEDQFRKGYAHVYE